MIPRRGGGEKLLTSRTLGYVALLLAAIYLGLRYVMLYVLPFVLGIILAFILEPAVRALSAKLRFRRPWAALVAVLVLVAGMGLVVAWSVTTIATELTDLYGYLPQYYGEFNRVVSEVLRIAGDISEQLPEPLAGAAQEQWNHLYSLLSVIVTGAGGVVKSLPAFALLTVFTFLSAYFVIKDRAAIGGFIRSIMPARAFEHFKVVEMDVVGGVAGFVRAQAIIIVLTMTVNVIGLRLMNTRYAVALGLLLAVLDILPIVGPGLVYVPWIAYHFIWGGAGYALWLLILYASVSLLRQVIQTHLVGKEMGLHPLVTLISLYTGAKVFGPPGLIYGPLAAIFIKALWTSGAIPHEGGASI
jgi:sporulation integral membrane protein YtvI